MAAAFATVFLVAGAGTALGGDAATIPITSKEGPPGMADRPAPPGLRADLERARAYQAWLKGSEAKQARQRSRTAHTADDRQGIAQLVREKFSGFLTSNDELTIPPEVVESYTSDYTAIVKPDADGKPGGGSTLAISSLPLRIETPFGTKEPVDFSLERVDGGELSPETPLADFSLPESLGEGIDLPGPASATLPSANAQVTPSLVEDNTALYPNIATDIDLLASAVPAGVQLSNLLRSAQSPEVLETDLQLPPGAHLEQTSQGGAQVVRDGIPLLGVYRPSLPMGKGSRSL